MSSERFFKNLFRFNGCKHLLELKIFPTHSSMLPICSANLQMMFSTLSIYKKNYKALKVGQILSMFYDLYRYFLEEHNLDFQVFDVGMR